MNNLASAYLAARQPDRAIPIYERVLKGVRATLAKTIPRRSTTLNNLASAYRNAGQPDRAIPLHEQALQGVEAKLGANHPLRSDDRQPRAGL